MSKYIEFVDAGTSESGKTRLWDVYPKGNRQMVLGEVSWYSPWRKYVFMPPSGTADVVFDQTCLRDVANFIEEQTKLHKGK